MHCPIHCPDPASTHGWGEHGENVPVVFVNMLLHELQTKTDILLSCHHGAMYLSSFPTCYEMTFGEPLPIDNSGVPLEHLLSCISTVTIIHESNTKMVKQINSNWKKQELDEESILKSIVPSLRTKIIALCKELVELLRTAERCIIIYTRFIPSYHHLFGKHCKVVDYGFNRLQQMLDAIPHVVQVVGFGDHRLVTLAHTAQMRRFQFDLGKIMRAQQYQPLELSQFPVLYEEILQRPFNPTEYGMCSLNDLLEQLPLNTVAINTSDGVTTIQIPKKDRTPEEVIKTKQFASDVVAFLRQLPRFTIAFNKFIPAYHRFFGIQCKVSDYGFTRLVELFEAIDDVVEIYDPPRGERQVRLTLQHSLRVLGLQLQTLIERDEVVPFIRVDELAQRYLLGIGFPLEPQMYTCNTIEELLEKLDDFVEVRPSSLGPLVSVSQKELLSTFMINVWHLLNEHPYEKKLSDLAIQYMARYNKYLMIANLNKIPHAVMIVTTAPESYVLLTPLYRVATEIYHLLIENGGQIPFVGLGEAYRKHYKVDLELPLSLTEFINEFQWLFVLKGDTDSQRISARTLTHDVSQVVPSGSRNMDQAGPSGVRNIVQAGPSGVRNIDQAGPSGVRNIVQAGPSGVRNVHQAGPSGVRNIYQAGPIGMRNVHQAGPSGVRNVHQAGPSGVRNVHQAGPSGVRNVHQADPSGVRNIYQAGPSGVGNVLQDYPLEVINVRDQSTITSPRLFEESNGESYEPERP